MNSISSNTKLKSICLVSICCIFVYNVYCTIICAWITKHYDKNCVDYYDSIMISSGIWNGVCFAIIFVTTILIVISLLANTIHKCLILFHDVIINLVHSFISAHIMIVKWLLLGDFYLECLIFYCNKLQHSFNKEESESKC